MAEGLQTGQEARLGRLLLVRPQQRERLHRPPLHELHRPPPPQLPADRLMGRRAVERWKITKIHKKTKTWEVGGKPFKSASVNVWNLNSVLVGWVGGHVAY